MCFLCASWVSCSLLALDARIEGMSEDIEASGQKSTLSFAVTNFSSASAIRKLAVVHVFVSQVLSLQ